MKDSIRKFVEVEIVPHIADWEKACELPRELFRKAGHEGIFGVAMPLEYGGTGGGMNALVDMIDEIGRAGSGGLLAAMTAHQIALPPLIENGSPQMKDSILPRVISGEIIAALSISEPQGGLDHMSELKVTANLQEEGVEMNADGSFCARKVFVLEGEKAFVTNGIIADLIFVAARETIDEDQAHGGTSIFVVERNAPGLTATKWSKTGSHCSDTASLFFDHVRVITYALQSIVSPTHFK
jgi:acyl-CoA dehydrogenase